LDPEDFADLDRRRPRRTGSARVVVEHANAEAERGERMARF
jgi:hypothetical protein